MNMDIESSIKKIFTNNIDNSDKLLDFIDNNIYTKECDKITYAEVPTPRYIRKNMINKFPNNFWKSPKKIFEPSAGKCVFIIEIINKFMNGLKYYIKDPHERYKIIVEECIYFSDINENNINICKLLIDPFNKYNLNYYIGDTLNIDINNKWKISEFDAIIGNPPFNKISSNKSCPLWNTFVVKMFSILKEGGYLSFITPTGWRAPKGRFRNIFNLIMDKKLIYLNMNSLEDGHRDFNVAISYDYYIVNNVINDNKTKTNIVDVKDNNYDINLSKWGFIPYSDFDLFDKLLAKDDEERVNILYDSSTYDSRKLSDTQTDEYKYPICYTITKKKGMNKLYSNVCKNYHFVPKVIWSNGIGTFPIVDYDGEYGCSQFSFGIIDDKKNLDKIKNCMENELFIDLMKNTKFTNNKYDYKTIGLFNKNFYDIFIK